MIREIFYSQVNDEIIFRKEFYFPELIQLMKIWKLTYLISEKKKGRKEEGRKKEEKRKERGMKKGRGKEGRKEGKRKEEKRKERGSKEEGKNKGRCYSITPADSNSYSTTDNRELERQMTMYFISS